MENLQLIRQRLEEYYSETYRKIWVQRCSRLTRRDITITLFPIGFGNYRIVTLRDLKMITYEEIFVELNRVLN